MLLLIYILLVDMEEKIIKTAKCGLLKVFVQGEIESRDFKRKSKAVFLTVHDLGSNYKSMLRFVNHSSMVNISSRYFEFKDWSSQKTSSMINPSPDGDFILPQVHVSPCCVAWSGGGGGGPRGGSKVPEHAGPGGRPRQRPGPARHPVCSGARGRRRGQYSGQVVTLNIENGKS